MHCRAGQLQGPVLTHGPRLGHVSAARVERMARLARLVDEHGLLRCRQIINSPHGRRMAVGKGLLQVVGPVLAHVDGENIPVAFRAHIKQGVQVRHFAKRPVAADGRVPSPPAPLRQLAALAGRNAAKALSSAADTCT